MTEISKKQVPQVDGKKTGSGSTAGSTVVKLATVTFYSVSILFVAGCLFRAAAWTIQGYKQMDKAIKS